MPDYATASPHRTAVHSAPHRSHPAACFCERATAPALLLGSLLLAGCGKEEAKPAAPPPAAVTVVSLTARDVAISRELPGRANPSLIAEVRPQVSGVIKRRLFEEGGIVTAGQPLYQLDDATYAADVQSAKATLARAAATLQAAELNGRRSNELVKIDAISRQEQETADASLAEASADVQVARAELARASVTLAYARIVAPISGRIGKSSVTQGALVTANQVDPLVVIQRLDPMYVDLTQSSSELLALRKDFASGKLSQPGKDVPVQIMLEDGSRFASPGKLDFHDVTVDPETGSVSLRVTVPNPAGVLLPGMYVRAEVGNGIRQRALLVPQQGVTRDPKGNATALVVGKNNKVALRKVAVNRAIGNHWLVDAGLVAGDRVIIEGLQKVKPGAIAAPVEAASAQSR